MPKKRLSQTELAYLAGIIDGEGSLILARRKYSSGPYKGQVHNYTAFLNVTNTNKDMLLWAAEKLSRYSQLTIKVYDKNSPSLKGLNRKKAYYLQICGFKMLYLLQDLLPYFIIKKKQAEKLIEWITYRKAVYHYGDNSKKHYGEYEETVKAEISRLNQRGAD